MDRSLPRGSKLRDPASEHQRSSYRPDVDGLRAVAVISIVLFHAGLKQFGGGFVGVDVFFVISGYLIGSAVDRDLRDGRFSLVQFYERRARRIIPALVFMLAGTAVLAFAYSMPAELAELGGVAVSVLIFASNIYFWRQSGYFAPAAETQPLLHTWSLGVEEQFYILFPLAMMACYRFAPQRVKSATLAVALVSFVVSGLALFQFQKSAFFLLPTRAWELLLGFVVALDLFPRLTNPRLRQLGAMLGLAFIILSVAGFTPRTPFPGPAAALPCLGAALIIAAGHWGSSVVGQLLATPPLVFIGLISYPLYLWHWPLIVFQRQDGVLLAGASPVLATAAVIGASVAVATVSWLAVERPLRSVRVIGRRRLFQAAGLAVVGAGLAGASAIASKGFPERFSDDARRAASFLTYDPNPSSRNGVCLVSGMFTASDFNQRVCLTPSRSKRNYLLMGDSHAASLWLGLQQAMPGANVMQATSSGCRPLLRAPADSWAECRKLIDFVLHDFLARYRVDKVVLSARWNVAELPQLAETLDWFRTRRIPVVLLGPIVQYDSAVPRLLANSLRTGDRHVFAEHRLRDIAVLDSVMRRIAERHRTRYISLWQLMCTRKDCLAAERNVPLQFDYGHFTTRGSLEAARLAVAGGLSP